MRCSVTSMAKDGRNGVRGTANFSGRNWMGSRLKEQADSIHSPARMATAVIGPWKV